MQMKRNNENEISPKPAYPCLYEVSKGAQIKATAAAIAKRVSSSRASVLAIGGEFYVSAEVR